MEIWKHVPYPVRSALCAAWMLREMARSHHADPLNRDQLRRNADDFENRAVAVQEQAEDDDLEMAVEALDCRLFLFHG